MFPQKQHRVLVDPVTMYHQYNCCNPSYAAPESYAPTLPVAPPPPDYNYPEFYVPPSHTTWDGAPVLGYPYANPMYHTSPHWPAANFTVPKVPQQADFPNNSGFKTNEAALTPIDITEGKTYDYYHDDPCLFNDYNASVNDLSNTSPSGNHGVSNSNNTILYNPGPPIVTFNPAEESQLDGKGPDGSNLFCFHLPNEITNWYGSMAALTSCLILC